MMNRNHFSLALPADLGRLWDRQDPWDRLSEGALGPWAQESQVSGWGQSQLEETPDVFLLNVDLPGVPKDQLKIHVGEGELTLEAHRGVAPNTRSFRKTYSVPASVDSEKIQAHMQDGVLHLALPKREAAKVRQIEVNEGKTSFWERFLPQRHETREA